MLTVRPRSLLEIPPLAHYTFQSLQVTIWPRLVPSSVSGFGLPSWYGCSDGEGIVLLGGP